MLRDSGEISYSLPHISKADINTNNLESYNVRYGTDVYKRAQNIINTRYNPAIVYESLLTQ